MNISAYCVDKLSKNKNDNYIPIGILYVIDYVLGRVHGVCKICWKCYRFRKVILYGFHRVRFPPKS